MGTPRKQQPSEQIPPDIPQEHGGRFRLLARRREALHAALGPDLTALLVNAFDRDDGDQSGADDVEARLIEVETRELARIQDAIERMRAGTYGQCIDCLMKIPGTRLDALPYAKRCISCQRKLERTGAQETMDVIALLERMEAECEEEE